jgi:hypothetical protein
MANNQNLTLLSTDGTYVGGVVTPIDLTGAVLSRIYYLDNGTSVVTSIAIFSGAKLGTKIVAGGVTYIVSELYGDVSVLVIPDCDACTEVPTDPVTIVSSCDNPVHVSDCDKEEYLEVLERIYEAVDELELKVENINLNAETINLNTDQIEEKLDLLIGLSTPILVENKSYKITDGQTITFAVGSVFSYAVGIFGGSANYTEGGSIIGDYTQGESFGNGDRNNLVLNSNSIVINALAGGDVRISVLQVPSYSPLIS